MNPIRMAIVSADRLMRDFLRHTIPTVEPRFTCVLESPCDREVLQRCRAAAPDLIVFDLAGRGAYELVMLGEFAGTASRSALLVIGDNTPSEFVGEFVARARCGFFSRDNSLEALARAAFLVASGGMYIDAPLHAHLFKSHAAGGMHFSARERHVLQLIAQGYSTKETANILGLSVKTVDKYRTAVMQKLGVHDVVKLTHCAIRLGFVTIT